MKISSLSGVGKPDLGDPKALARKVTKAVYESELRRMEKSGNFPDYFVDNLRIRMENTLRKDGLL